VRAYLAFWDCYEEEELVEPLRLPRRLMSDMFDTGDD
jgi:hypothetical protein